MISCVEGLATTHPFGIDVFGENIFWTDWNSLNIEMANKITGQNRSVLVDNISSLMDVRVFHRNRVTNVKTACTNGNNGGCSHLCLLRPKGYSCKCSIGIKLGVSNFLF